MVDNKPHKGLRVKFPDLNGIWESYYFNHVDKDSHYLFKCPDGKISSVWDYIHRKDKQDGY
jgi:hypothetical protein